MAAPEFSYRLTRRQRECMELVAEGQTAKLIARELGISHRTVETHIATAIEALGASNRLGAVGRYVELKREESSASEDAAFMLCPLAHPSEINLIEAEEQAPAPVFSKPETWPWFPPVGGSINDAPREVRLRWIIRIALSALMLTCAIILSILGLIEIAQ